MARCVRACRLLAIRSSDGISVPPPRGLCLGGATAKWSMHSAFCRSAAQRYPRHGHGTATHRRVGGLHASVCLGLPGPRSRFAYWKTGLRPRWAAAGCHFTRHRTCKRATDSTANNPPTLKSLRRIALRRLQRISKRS